MTTHCSLSPQQILGGRAVSEPLNAKIARGWNLSSCQDKKWQISSCRSDDIDKRATIYTRLAGHTYILTPLWDSIINYNKEDGSWRYVISHLIWVLKGDESLCACTMSYPDRNAISRLMWMTTVATPPRWYGSRFATLPYRYILQFQFENYYSKRRICQIHLN